jgi:DNA helicase-2/ATP-dependent DNA helicase PcrA
VTLEGLNSPQREAVLHDGGPLVVFAGAGSGKTRVITHRVARLVGELDVRPWRILAVTFTNKAAGEMRERLGGLIGGRSRELWMGTFHATCARLLRRYAEPIGISKDFVIYDDADQKAMVKRILRDKGLDEKRYGAKQVAGRINRAKQELLSPDEVEISDPYAEVVRDVYADYEARMRRCSALDFGDLIYRLVRALEEEEGLRDEIAGRFSHVLVDEFQDTNHAQYRLVRALSASHRNVCVVGDDDQSIYRWRGADRRNILDFKEDYPDATVIKLEQNYRSTQRILRIANAVIERNFDREPKRLWTENEEGPKAVVVRCEDERDEARMVMRAVRELIGEGRALSDVAVFYRTHAQSRVIEEQLRASNVAYRIVGGMRFYDRAEVKDLLAYLRVIANPDDDVSLLRIINTPSRGIGKTTTERLLDVALRRGSGVWGALEHVDEEDAFGAAAKKKLGKFRVMIAELRRKVAEGLDVGSLAEAVIEETGYLEMLQGDDTPEADARMQNLAELVGSVNEYAQEAEDPSLSGFLELVTLQTSADESKEGDRLTLMTVHAAKGLEFPVVLVTGLEEQMFPMRGTEAFEDPEELEEERRLAYVAFTRAEERLILSYASVRRIYGQMKVGQPSRFILELPPDDVSAVGMGRSPQEMMRGRVGARTWGNGPGYRRSAPIPKPDKPLRPSGDEAYVDRSEGSDFEELYIGMAVRHAKFGVGNVTGVTDGVPPRVRVAFPSWGEKTLVASYLEPA